MRRTSDHAQLTSSPEYLVCPACGYGALRRRGSLSRWAECESCCCAFDGITVGTLEQIAALPDALGEHACEECGHPEMRSLPDGTFHCPACRSEVVPAGSDLFAVVSHAEEGEQRRGAATTGRERGAEQGYSKTVARGSTNAG
jgi:ribosomal protein L37AE/L43A